MEGSKSFITCRTCLGRLHVSRNLREAEYYNLFELLYSILGFEIKEEVFKVCKKCEKMLKSILKFKDQCIKSIEKYVDFDCKKEPFEGDLEYQPSLVKNCVEPRFKKLKRKGAEPIESIHLEADNFDWSRDSADSFNNSKELESNVNNEPDGGPSKRGIRLDQFPRKAISEAISECRSFFTKAKHKSCLHCNYIGKTARGLSVHMSFMHSILAPNWCYQCNIQTVDLPTHRKRTQCSLYYCKFCGKYACPIKRATEHLRFHCSRESLDDVLSKRGLWHKQFNRKDVLGAIAEHRSYFTDALSTTCLHCDYIGETARGLSIHMSTLHRDDAKNWCYRCNIQTVDIEEHKNATKCFLYFCKFCDKYTCLIKHATTHLESHCHGLSSFEENAEGSENLETENEENLDDSTSNHDFDIQNTDLNKATEQEITDFLQEEDAAFDQNIIFNTNTASSPNDDTILLSAPQLLECSEFSKYPHRTIEKALEQITKPFYATRQCPVCEVVLLNLRHLQKHVRLKHRDLKYTWCCRCNTLEENLVEHSKGHLTALFQCVFCDKSFEHGHEIKNHLISHSADSSNRELKAVWINCKYCPNSFANEAEFKNHRCPNAPPLSQQTKQRDKLITKRLKETKASKPKLLKPRKSKTVIGEAKTLISDRKFKKCDTKKPKETQLCSICGIVIKRLEFKMHMKIHNGLMFKCSHCDKQFTHKIYLIEHERRHTGEKPFHCGVCGKGFITSSECKRHERIHEGGPQQCPLCDVQCNRPERLKLHMKRHTGENKYTCAHCNISFHIKSLLLKHIKTHSDERPHKCSYCEQYFKHREEATVHERNHTGIRPYSCTLCSFTSVRSKDLTNHMKKHPEDVPQANTPFNCQFCTKKFSTNAMLVSHTRNQHQDQ